VIGHLWAPVDRASANPATRQGTARGSDAVLAAVTSSAAAIVARMAQDPRT
jgi:hypothetical protein